MDARELIEHISRSDRRLDILCALRERSAKPGELADRADVERTPVYTALEDLEESGAVASIDGRRKLTAAGDIPVAETLDACEAVGREAIFHLASSTDNNRLRILGGLADSLSRGEMVHDDSYPSRSTINRTLEDFEAFGWITPRPNSTLTKAGRAVYDAYTELDRVVNIVVDKLVYLRHVDPSKVDIPIDLIDDARVVRSRPNRPQRADAHMRERINEGFGHAKVFASYYSEAEVTPMFDQVEQGSSWEAVTPLPSHAPLPDSPPEIKHFRMGLGSERVEWTIYPDDLPIDMILFDSDRVLLGTDVELETTRTDAILDSTNPSLIEWSHDLYDEHKKRASTPLDYLLDPIKEKGIYRALRLDWARGRTAEND
ncbi:transcriptional regulator FilR1 domain-containing protein [Halococcus hamelinensis]|uniref:Transcriptional regulator n=1 Tax=Halococcus hamelinensis 100A6 TaxID=1132509 RepID=M0M8F3_9EURY|nr:winged helix-turn-helix domain-containing protein [Halococcus hamelinensis]EMA41996.1 transcriptional regulator [Halococcus hamelinensis 100A6]